MRRWIVGMLALLVCFAQTPQSSPAVELAQPAVRLDLVTYAQLGNEIKAQHGKVVLVDFWADYCRPCKEKFPHVLALHKKYAARGLSIVSVSVDDVSDADVRERVKDYLVQQRATCRNLLLAEKPETWVPKLKIDSVPALVLFDQQGRMINRWLGNEIDLPAIEKRIAELLEAPQK